MCGLGSTYTTKENNAALWEKKKQKNICLTSYLSWDFFFKTKGEF